MDNRRPSVLMVVAKWWPLSARLATELMLNRCRLSAMCPEGHPLTHIGGLETVVPYRGMASMKSLSKFLRTVGPDVVVPCDDGVVAQLHVLHETDPALRPLIEKSIGTAQGFPTVANRYRLLSQAAELGILVPETWRVSSTDDLVRWHDQKRDTAVLKIDGECGGNGVRICNAIDESLLAWQELTTRITFATAFKRWIVNRDPLAFWSYRNRKPPDVTVQRLVRGQPANCMLACRNGEVLAVVSVAVLASDGPTGAATVIKRVVNADMERAARKLAAHLELSGFVGLDFMIDSSTGKAYLIEMNPRCTQLGHLRFGADPSLAGIFAANLRGVPPSELGGALPLNTIALFPQALGASLDGAESARTGYLDVPWGEPALIEELRKRPWPERRWLSRVYHAFRPAARSERLTQPSARQLPAPTQHEHATYHQAERAEGRISVDLRRNSRL